MSKARYITGLRAVEQLLSRDGTNIVKLFVEHRAANPRVTAVVDQAKARGVDVQPANRARLQQMGGDARHQGVVAEIRRDRMLDDAGLRTLVESKLTSNANGRVLLLILDGIQDPHNLGACLRSADAAGVDAVVVPRHGAAGLGPTVSKVAAGAAETLPFASINNIGKVLTWLGEYGVRVVGTSDSAEKTLYDADLSGSVALVMGEEHGGLPERIAARCDDLLSLPMQGAVASLNVSVATGVCLYEIVRQRLAAGALDAGSDAAPD